MGKWKRRDARLLRVLPQERDKRIFQSRSSNADLSDVDPGFAQCLACKLLAGACVLDHNVQTITEPLGVIDAGCLLKDVQSPAEFSCTDDKTLQPKALA